jgi:hypothetical protein
MNTHAHLEFVEQALLPQLLQLVLHAQHLLLVLGLHVRELVAAGHGARPAAAAGPAR